MRVLIGRMKNFTEIGLCEDAVTFACGTYLGFHNLEDAVFFFIQQSLLLKGTSNNNVFVA